MPPPTQSTLEKIMALYERTSQATPDGALVSFSVLYDATALAAPTVQEVGVAPFAGKIVYASTLVNTAVNADTAVTIEIDGGSALDTLQTGTTKGTVDSYSRHARRDCRGRRDHGDLRWHRGLRRRDRHGDHAEGKLTYAFV
jgi:hypothetical protein